MDAYLVVSRHNFDDFPVSLHDTLADALPVAQEIERNEGPPSPRALPTWDVTEFLRAAVVQFVGGKPVRCFDSAGVDITNGSQAAVG